MFNKSSKIYTYFFQNTAEIEKRLADLSVFNFASLLSADDSQALTNRLKLVSDNFAKKELNEFLWLDKQLFNFIDLDLIQQFLSAPDKDKINLLSGNLKLVNTAIGEEDNLVRYNSDEIIACLNLSKKDFDYFSLIFSLRQELLDQYNRDLVKAIFSYLQKLSVYKDWEIKELIVLVCLLNIVWKNFEFLLPVEQAYLLNLFFYISIFIGIPVTNILKNSIYQTNNPVDFVVKNQFLAAELEKTIEVVPTDENFAKARDLKYLFDKQFASNLDPISFAKTIYNKPGQEFLANALAQSITIYVGLKNSNLIEKNYAGEDNIADDYDFQFSDLLTYFMVKNDWPKIKAYYQNPKPLVPVKAVIDMLSMFVDLDKSQAIETLSEFTEFLKNEKLLSTDEDIIVYDEQKGKFDWVK